MKPNKPEESPLTLGGIPVQFSFSAHQNKITLYVNLDQGEDWRKSTDTDKGSYFYEAEAKRVAKSLRRTFNLSKHDLGWVVMEEYLKNTSTRTGKKLYWIKVEFPVVEKMFRSMIKAAIETNIHHKPDA